MRKKQTKTLLFLVVLAGLAALTSGCTSGAQADEGLAEGMVGSQDVFDTGANYREYLARLDDAHERIATCMQERGFEYLRPPMNLIGRPGAQEALANTEKSDLEFAANWGFGLTTVQNFTPTGPDLPTGPDGGVAPPDPTPVPLASLSADDKVAYEAALLGPGGCQEGGFVNLGLGNEEFFAKADAIRGALDAFASSEPVVEFYREWSACMAARGHDYPSPVAARRALETRFREALDANRTQYVDTALRQQEIALAVDTVECGGPSRDLLEPELADTWVEIASRVL